MPVPTRTCVGCRRAVAREQLVRMCERDGRLAIGRPSRGRSAYVCPAVECFDEAVRRRSFARALRRPVDIGGDLRTQVAAVNGSRKAVR